MNGLFELLYDNLPVAPSRTLPDGTTTRGWTLRPERLNASAVRFDWIHGAAKVSQGHRGDVHERAALRDDVLAAAARVAREAGFRVKADGIGLVLVAPVRKSETHH